MGAQGSWGARANKDLKFTKGNADTVPCYAVQNKDALG